MSESRVDTRALRAEFDVCGACDYGVAVGCSCSKRDPRPVIGDLCDEVDHLRAQLFTYTASREQLNDWADAGKKLAS